MDRSHSFFRADSAAFLHAWTIGVGVFAAALTSEVVAQIVSQNGAPTQAQASGQQETPWPVILGIRTAALERSWPIIDKLVLVPDGRTYLDEIAKWSEKGRWPVLFADDLYAPLFARGFRPAKVELRESVGAMPVEREAREKLMATAAAEAIFDGSSDVIGSCAARDFAPPMIVITDATDPAWTAALALSAGRGAPMHFTSEDFGRPNESLDARRFARLAQQLEVAADRTGLPWKGLGDAIDAFVVCRDIAWKCVPELAPGLAVEINSGAFPTAPGQPLATTNVLGRHADGIWWAVGSVISGSEARSAYAAMSSLFAPRRSAWLFHTYDAGKPWDLYDTALAAPIFEKQGFVVQSWGRDQCTLDGWRRILMGGFGCDLLFVNSHGIFSQFGMAAGGTATARDVPIFDRPAMVHFLHSFSLENPTNPECIGGSFLEHGAYAFFGSVYEPLLVGFVQPELVANRAQALIPFAASPRLFEGPLARPWRTMSYGDPLALIAPPSQIGLRRVEPEADGATGLRDLASTSLTRFRDTKDPAALVEAMRLLEWCGDDERVRQVWQLARATDAVDGASQFALGALFRERDFDGYAAAFATSSKRDGIAREMLWQLAVPRLATLVDPRVAALLGRSLRGPDPTIDLVMLKPAAVRLLGNDGWRQICDKARAEAASDSMRAKIDSVR